MSEDSTDCRKSVNAVRPLCCNLLLHPGSGAEYYDELLFLCLSVHVSHGPRVRTSPTFLYILPMAMTIHARYSEGPL